LKKEIQIKRPKILIVDNDIENLRSIEKILQIFDIELIRALSGNEAKGKIINTDFALTLINVKLPDMSGFDFVKLFQQIDKRKYLPVIFLSTISIENHSEFKDIESYAFDFILKPFIPKILIGKVKIFLNIYEQKKKLEFLLDEQKQINHELINAKTKAENATKAKSIFLANMSHEIRTPLNGIIGVTEIISHMDLSKEQKKYLNIIQISSNSLITIINDILDFSKIESKQVELENIKFNLYDEINEIIKILSYAAKDSYLDLIVNIENDVPKFIIGDSVKLKQILINIINNAIKFTKKGSVKLEVNVEKIVGNKVNIKFQITDTGIGISEAGQKKLFKTFSQAETSTMNKYGGTGLGLSISKSLAKLMNGKIGVISKEGEGSNFWFTAQFELAKKTKVLKIDTPDKEILQTEEKLSVLLAEDNIINQKVAMFNLNKMGYDVDVAINGVVAVDKFKNKKFDVILMDIQMPEMDGIQATKVIREIEKQTNVEKKVLIIAMTANAMKGDREYFIKAGMDQYISKPFKSVELKNLIHENIDNY